MATSGSASSAELLRNLSGVTLTQASFQIVNASFHQLEREVFLKPTCHSVAHAIGKAIYEHVGLTAAIRLCWYRCTGGCIHGVLGAHVTSIVKGAPFRTVPAILTPACRDPLLVTLLTLGECAHSVGHALVLSGQFELSAMLRICLLTGQQLEPARQLSLAHYCSGGVFMQIGKDNQDSGREQTGVAGPLAQMQKAVHQCIRDTADAAASRGACFYYRLRGLLQTGDVTACREPGQGPLQPSPRRGPDAIVAISIPSGAVNDDTTAWRGNERCPQANTRVRAQNLIHQLCSSLALTHARGYVHACTYGLGAAFTMELEQHSCAAAAPTCERPAWACEAFEEGTPARLACVDGSVFRSSKFWPAALVEVCGAFATTHGRNDCIAAGRKGMYSLDKEDDLMRSFIDERTDAPPLREPPVASNGLPPQSPIGAAPVSSNGLLPRQSCAAPRKVFYLSLHRSGTTAFHTFAGTLGLRSYHNTRASFRSLDLHRTDSGRWLARNRSALVEWLNRYEAFSDLPVSTQEFEPRTSGYCASSLVLTSPASEPLRGQWPLLFETIDELLGERAVFLLGTRDAQGWWRSMYTRYSYPGHTYTSPLRQMMYGGDGHPLARDEGVYRSVFEAHVARVREYFTSAAAPARAQRFMEVQLDGTPQSGLRFARAAASLMTCCAGEGCEPYSERGAVDSNHERRSPEQEYWATLEPVAPPANQMASDNVLRHCPRDITFLVHDLSTMDRGQLLACETALGERHSAELRLTRHRCATRTVARDTSHSYSSSVRRATAVFAGDLALSGAIDWALSGGGRRFSLPLERLSPLLPPSTSGELRFLNLEGVLSLNLSLSHAAEPGGSASRPRKAQSVRTVEALHSGGFDVVSLANNHVLNWGGARLLETVDLLGACGIRHVGAAVTQRGAPPLRQRPLLIERGGVHFAFFAYLASSNEAVAAACSPHPTGQCTRPFLVGADGRTMEDDVRDFQSGGRADVMIVSLHTGVEFQRDVDRQSRALMRHAVRLGAHVVVGHHPHVPQGVEIVDGRLIVYSLGQLVTQHDQAHLMTHQLAKIQTMREFGISVSTNTSSGLLIRCTFEESVPDGAVALVRVEYAPIAYHSPEFQAQALPARWRTLVGRVSRSTNVRFDLSWDAKEGVPTLARVGHATAHAEECGISVGFEMEFVSLRVRLDAAVLMRRFRAASKHSVHSKQTQSLEYARAPVAVLGPQRLFKLETDPCGDVRPLCARPELVSEPVAITDVAVAMHEWTSFAERNNWLSREVAQPLKMVHGGTELDLLPEDNGRSKSAVCLQATIGLAIHHVVPFMQALIRYCCEGDSGGRSVHVKNPANSAQPRGDRTDGQASPRLCS